MSYAVKQNSMDGTHPTVCLFLAGQDIIVPADMSKDGDWILREAHQLMVQRAETLLPLTVPGGWP